MSDFEIGWEKFKFPDEKEDEEDYSKKEEEEYSDTPTFKIPNIFPSEHPFYQLKTFNFWTGHTNFPMSPAVADIITKVIGVETLDIISSYRFHMSVGLRFDDIEIRQRVTSEVVEYLENYEKNGGNEQYN